MTPPLTPPLTQSIEYPTGAVRSADVEDVRYDLITPVGLRRLAATYAEGARKYTDRNWEKGFPISVMLNHAFNHLVCYLAGDGREDHLAHAAWNLLAAMHFEERRPELQDIPARKAAETRGMAGYDSAEDSE